jgi:TPR repeat protein
LKGGFGPAEFELGKMYFHGTGMPQDLPEAIKWFRKAAEHGVASAQNQLGFAYAHGQGVRQDYFQAEKWYRLAAENGSPEGQHNLTVILALGRGGFGVGTTVEAERATASPVMHSHLPVAAGDLPGQRNSLDQDALDFRFSHE